MPLHITFPLYLLSLATVEVERVRMRVKYPEFFLQEYKREDIQNNVVVQWETFNSFK